MLIISSRAPEFEVAKVVKTWPKMLGYMRVRNHELFPALSQTNLVMVDGEYTEIEGGEISGTDPCSAIDVRATGKSAYPPGGHDEAWTSDEDRWEGARCVDSMGCRGTLLSPQSSGGRGADGEPGRSFVAGGRQLVTNAHPLVEMSFI